MSELAERIVAYRAKERINQRQFAERAGLSVQTVCNIENGIADPSRVTVAKIMLVIDDGKKEEK